jgi:hypothetical protein
MVEIVGLELETHHPVIEPVSVPTPIAKQHGISVLPSYSHPVDCSHSTAIWGTMDAMFALRLSE